MLSSFSDELLESVSRLSTDTDFIKIKNYLLKEARALSVSSLTMSGDKMYRTQGAAVLIFECLRALDNAREVMASIKGRRNRKRQMMIDGQIKNSL